MSFENDSLHLPDYDDFVESIAVLSLPISPSELHGMMCAYLCAGATEQGESFLHALLNNKKDKSARAALVSLFSLFSASQQQISSLDFSFEMLLPSDSADLMQRAKAFTQWCEGFTDNLNLSGIDADKFEEEESQEAFLHIAEFSKLDCESLQIGEDDEKAFMEICEYTRMAVLRLHSDLMTNKQQRGGAGKKH